MHTNKTTVLGEKRGIEDSMYNKNQRKKKKSRRAIK